MKKNILIAAILLTGTMLYAQQVTEYDAIKLTSNDITGTARYMGMAGAFGALGGDASAIKDNPAGLGIYRSSEIVTSVNFMTQRSNSTWNSVKGNDDLFKVRFNNLSYVMALPTWSAKNGSSNGFLHSNWGFSYNKLKNFDRRSTVKGNSGTPSITDFMAGFTNGIDAKYLDPDSNIFDDIYTDPDASWIPWLSVLAHDAKLIEYTGNGDDSHTWSSILFDGEKVTPKYMVHEWGYTDEYSLSWAGNFSNKFYLGMALNFQTLRYNKSSIYEEGFGDNDHMSLESILRTRGTGFNFHIGAIYRPVDFIRLGLAYRTPTLYTMTDYNYSSIRSGINYTEGYVNRHYKTPEAETFYDFRMPGQLTGSLAFIIGKKALISADVNYTEYKNIKLYDSDGDSYYYEDENNGMKDVLKSGLTFKLGGEYRINNNFSVRLGGAYQTPYTNNESHKLVRDNTTRTDMEYSHHKWTNYFTAGLGYRSSFWFADVAFVNKNIKEEFFPYNYAGVTPASVTTSNFDVIATVGFRF